MNDRRRTAWRWRHVDAVALGVCAGMTLAVYVAGERPLMLKQQQRDAQQAVLIEASKHVAQMQVAARTQRSRLTEMREQLDASRIHLEPTTQLNHRLAQLNELATEAGLTVEQLQPQAMVTSADVQVIPIDMHGSGGYPASMTFLRLVHARFADMGVAGFDLTATGDGRFRMSLTWYTAPTADDALAAGS